MVIIILTLIVIIVLIITIIIVIIIIINIFPGISLIEVSYEWDYDQSTILSLIPKKYFSAMQLPPSHQATNNTNNSNNNNTAQHTPAPDKPAKIQAQRRHLRRLPQQQSLQR